MDAPNANPNPTAPKPAESAPTGATPANPPSATPPTGSATANGDNDVLFAILGYIFPILFFLPLVTQPTNRQFARFHANQQVLLLIWFVAANVIVAIPLLGWLAAPIMWLAGIVFIVLGVIHSAHRQTKELPFIGKYKLIS